MTNFSGIDELWRRALELNVRYYTSLGKLTAEYFKDLAVAMSSVSQAAGQQPTAAAPAGARPVAAPRPAAQPAATPVTVLEGEAGSTAMGVFLVGNSLPQDVSARVSASPMVDENGRQGKVEFVFDPPVISLRAGEQLLVRVMAVIDPTLDIGASYRGELSIPELGGTRIPVSVRRRAAAKDTA